MHCFFLKKGDKEFAKGIAQASMAVKPFCASLDTHRPWGKVLLRAGGRAGDIFCFTNPSN
jgi:hypothetical protein